MLRTVDDSSADATDDDDDDEDNLYVLSDEEEGFVEEEGYVCGRRVCRCYRRPRRSAGGVGGGQR